MTTVVRWATEDGRELIFVARVPEANPHEQLVLFDPEYRSIETFWADGRYNMNGTPSHMDVSLKSSRKE